MTNSAHDIPRIDLWILGTMRPKAEIARRFSIGEMQRIAIDDAVNAARSAGLHQPGTATAQAVREFFGMPSNESAGHLIYALKLWPGHVYEWTTDAVGRITHSTFKIRDVPIQERGASEIFEPWRDTEYEVRKALGNPISEEGWWPEHSLRYRRTGNSEDLVFTFDHGLLMEIANEK